MKVKLSDVCVEGGIQTGPFGAQLHQSDYSDQGTPVCMPVNLVDGSISENGIARVTDEHVERLSRYKVKAGDLLYARRGDVGRGSLVGENEDGWLCGTGCLKVTPDPNKIDSRYLFYLMSLPEAVGWLVNHAKGTTMLNLNTGILSSLPLDIENDLEKQQRIADALSAYDELIENSRRQIKLLEEAAQRLYKEWFVDLKFPGHETTPINNGLPEGWEESTLESVSNLISRGITPDYADETGYLVLGQRCVRNHLIELTHARAFVPKPSLSKWIKRNDILINSTGVGSLGRTAQVWFDPVGMTVDSHVTILRAQTPELACYLGQWAFFNESYIESLHTGSTGQTELPRERVAVIKLKRPTDNLLALFCEAVVPMGKKIVLLQKAASSAREARDRLLPKLMSGEIEV